MTSSRILLYESQLSFDVRLPYTEVFFHITVAYLHVLGVCNDTMVRVASEISLSINHAIVLSTWLVKHNSALFDPFALCCDSIIYCDREKKRGQKIISQRDYDVTQ